LKIFIETKKLVQKEKEYTVRILKNLMIIERDKLYTDLKYGSLHSYLVYELKYSDTEACIRVNSVRLMLKAPKAIKEIEKGKLTVTNAAKANKAISEFKVNDKEKIDELIETASKTSKKKFEKYLEQKFDTPRREVLVLDERTINKFDRFRKKNHCDELSSYEIVNILLERNLTTYNAHAPFRKGKLKYKKSRYIPVKVKATVNTGECSNCGKQWGLEYDHIIKYSHGGSSEVENIQMLCRSCNQRKEIKARQTGFFA
jgi:5-methylcytosine-specific restriction endonuclease McrA